MKESYATIYLREWRRRGGKIEPIRNLSIHYSQGSAESLKAHRFCMLRKWIHCGYLTLRMQLIVLQKPNQLWLS